GDDLTVAPRPHALIAAGRPRRSAIPERDNLEAMPTDHVAQLKNRVCQAVDRRAAELIATADWIHAHPEIGHQEVEASKRLSGMLQSAGVPVEMGTAGMATAFKAEISGKSNSPRIAILAEYDALPGLGHGCGH